MGCVENLSFEKQQLKISSRNPSTAAHCCPVVGLWRGTTQATFRWDPFTLVYKAPLSPFQGPRKQALGAEQDSRVQEGLWSYRTQLPWRISVLTASCSVPIVQDWWLFFPARDTRDTRLLAVWWRVELWLPYQDLFVNDLYVEGGVGEGTAPNCRASSGFPYRRYTENDKW